MKHRKSLACRIVILILCLSCLAGSVHAATTEPELFREIDRYLGSCADNARIPAMSVTIVDKEQVVFSGSYGDCQSCDTPFLLGSVSKSFTAVCIMQLVEQGKIDLQANLSTYLPHAADGDKITVSQLLNHTSGLGEHQTLDNYKITREQGVHHYANVNYSLLGEIIEAVSGQSCEDYVTEHIFEPLRLSHTAASLEKSIENGLMDGYTNYWGFPVKRSPQYPKSKSDWITVPAGYITSSTNDLGKYLQMYLNEGSGILSKKSIDTMFYGDTVYVGGDVPYWYGYGWATIKDPLPELVLRHSGLVETGTSCVFVLPERGLAVAITANVNDYFVTDGMMDSLGWGVVLMLLGMEPNPVSGSAYLLRHFLIDFILLAVLLAAILPLCCLHGYGRKVKNRKKGRTLASLLVCHVLAPVFLLVVIPLIFATPLWVAWAFAPDVTLTVIVSAALLFVSGVIKSVILFHK